VHKQAEDVTGEHDAVRFSFVRRAMAAADIELWRKEFLVALDDFLFCMGRIGEAEDCVSEFKAVVRALCTIMNRSHKLGKLERIRTIRVATPLWTECIRSQIAKAALQSDMARFVCRGLKLPCDPPLLASMILRGDDFDEPFGVGFVAAVSCVLLIRPPHTALRAGFPSPMQCTERILSFFVSVKWLASILAFDLFSPPSTPNLSTASALLLVTQCALFLEYHFGAHASSPCEYPTKPQCVVATMVATLMLHGSRFLSCCIDTSRPEATSGCFPVATQALCAGVLQALVPLPAGESPSPRASRAICQNALFAASVSMLHQAGESIKLTAPTASSGPVTGSTRPMAFDSLATSCVFARFALSVRAHLNTLGVVWMPLRCIKHFSSELHGLLGALVSQANSALSDMTIHRTSNEVPYELIPACAALLLAVRAADARADLILEGSLGPGVSQFLGHVGRLFGTPSPGCLRPDPASENLDAALAETLEVLVQWLHPLDVASIPLFSANPSPVVSSTATLVPTLHAPSSWLSLLSATASTSTALSGPDWAAMFPRSPATSGPPEPSPLLVALAHAARLQSAALARRLQKRSDSLALLRVMAYHDEIASLGNAESEGEGSQRASYSPARGSSATAVPSTPPLALGERKLQLAPELAAASPILLVPRRKKTPGTASIEAVCAPLAPPSRIPTTPLL